MRKRYYIALGSFTIAFLLGTMLVIPVFNKKNGFEVIQENLLSAEIESLYSGEPSGGIIENDTVYWENQYARLEVTPHTSTGLIRQTQYANLTWKWADMDVDIAFRFDESLTGSKDIWCWQDVDHDVPVPTYGFVTYNFTLINISDFTELTETPVYVDYGDIPSDKYYEGYINETLFTIGFDTMNWLDAERTKAIFYYDVYEVNGEEIEVQTWKEWVSHKSDFQYEIWNGKHYYYITDVPMKKDKSYDVKWMYNIPKNTEGKWDLMAKPSSETIAEVLANGHYCMVDPWWDSDWTYKKKITIDNTKVSGSSDLSNFPVLINITDTDLRDDAQNDGDDIAFTNSAEDTQLYHEIESFDGATGELYAWINTSTLIHDSDTEIYMYYGNGACSSQEDVTNTWNSNYIAVYHMNSTDTVLYDSTENRPGTKGGNTDPEETTGVVAKAQDFEASNSEKIYADKVGAILDITIEAWYTPESAIGNVENILSNQYDGMNVNGKGFSFWRHSNGKLRFGVYASNVQICGFYTSDALAQGSTYYCAGIYDDDNFAKSYINGVKKGEDTTISGNMYDHASAKLMIGAEKTGATYRYHCDGIIDEVRISDIPRSEDWIKTTYNTIIYGYDTGFFSMGSEESSLPSNTIPELSSPSPANESTDISKYPTLSITVADAEDDEQNMNVSWYWGTTSACSNYIMTNSSVNNGTYIFSDSDNDGNFSSYGTKYYWKVIVDDGTEQVEEVYHFTTVENNAPTIEINYPRNEDNQTESPVGLSVVIADADSHTMDIKWYGDGVLLNTDSSKSDGTYTYSWSVNHTGSGRHEWNVSVDDSYNSTDTDTYTFNLQFWNDTFLNEDNATVNNMTWSSGQYVVDASEGESGGLETPTVDDTSSSGSGGIGFSSDNWQHTCGDYEDDVLIVMYGGEEESSKDTITSVEYAGISLNQAVFARADEGTYTADAWIYYLLNPPTGENTIWVNFSGNFRGGAGGAVSVYNVAQEAPKVAKTEIINPDPSGISTDITTGTDNSFIVDCVADGDGSRAYTDGAGATTIFDTAGNSCESAGSYELRESQGTETVSWTFSNTVYRASHSVASFNASELPSSGTYWEANITSNKISKNDSAYWDVFNVGVNNSINSTFSIINATTDVVIKADIVDGEDISDVSDTDIRLLGEFDGAVAIYSWNVSWAGESNTAPSIDDTNPINETTGVSVNIDMIYFNITDANGDNMNYTYGYFIEGCALQGSSASSVTDGGYGIIINTGACCPLSYNTQYSWWLNVTDDDTYTNETFVFTTEAEPRTWQEIQDWNITISNQSTWSQISDWNITLQNSSTYTQITDWNITLQNSSSAWQETQDWNITISNQSTWSQISDWNITLQNSSTYTQIADWNITLQNSSTYTQIADWNVTLQNSSSAWQEIQDWNITISNTSTYTQIADWNITISNTSTYTQIAYWFITLSNSSSSYQQLQDWNITLQNSSTYTQIADWNITLQNSSTYTQIADWNITLQNSSSAWQETQDWNITISNTSTYTQIADWNITISNTSGDFTLLQDWNITLQNSSSAWQETQDWNITISNTSTYTQITDWNITISNTSGDFTLLQDWNITLQNSSSAWQETQDWNITISNTSTYTQITDWNITLQNSSTYTQISDWNITLQNESGTWQQIQDWNITLQNHNSFTQIADWNITLMNGTGTPSITITNEFPSDNSFNAPLQPLVYATVNSTVGNTLNVSIYYGLTEGNENTLLGTDSLVGNGTYDQTFFQASGRATRYYWRIQADDGETYVNETFNFRTEGFPGGSIGQPSGSYIFGVIGILGIALLPLVLWKLKKRREDDDFY